MQAVSPSPSQTQVSSSHPEDPTPHCPTRTALQTRPSARTAMPATPQLLQLQGHLQRTDSPAAARCKAHLLPRTSSLLTTALSTAESSPAAAYLRACTSSPDSQRSRGTPGRRGRGRKRSRVQRGCTPWRPARAGSDWKVFPPSPLLKAACFPSHSTPCSPRPPQAGATCCSSLRTALCNQDCGQLQEQGWLRASWLGVRGQLPSQCIRWGLYPQDTSLLCAAPGAEDSTN